MPPQGPAVANAQRYERVIDEMADELVCPITQELPVEPVTAEDGRIYEKAAIEDWLLSRQGQTLKSWVTDEPMGDRLFPAVQARNTIKGMVQSGAITGAKADKWKKRIEDEERVADLRRKAEAGDAAAMMDLHFAYRDADYGLKKDEKQAFAWAKRAADSDNVSGLTELADCYALGIGVDENEARALFHNARAADRGSEIACYAVAQANRLGLLGLEKDPVEASKWYRKMATCAIKNASQSARDKAAEWLHEQHDAVPTP